MELIGHVEVMSKTPGRMVAGLASGLVVGLGGDEGGKKERLLTS
jgi:hypothetical protein